MKSFHNMASVVRNRVFRTSVSRQAAGMDPEKRAALVDQVGTDLSLGRDDALLESLREIEGELAEAEHLLLTSQGKEQFLGVRVRKYRKALDDQAEQLRRERNQLKKRDPETAATDGGATDGVGDVDTADMDEETAEERELERRMEKWEKDEDALQKIVATHKDILVYCETIRRKIRELKAKREEVSSKAQECQEFLLAAAEAEEAHFAGTEAAEEEEESRTAVEMSSLAPSEQQQQEHQDEENTIQEGIGTLSLGETSGAGTDQTLIIPESREEEKVQED
jgi:hypothetical protein